MAITVLATDASLNPVGDPISDWTSLDCTTRFNAVGAGQLTAPVSAALMDLVTEPGNRLMVILDGRVFLEGPIEKPGATTWSAESPDDADPGKVTVTFASDEAYLARRITYPDPGLDPDAQVTEFYISTGNSEAILRDLVNVNAGLGALAARRTNTLVLGTLASVGTTLATGDYTRFEPLMEVLRRVALVGGGIGFRLRNVDRALTFEAYEPADRSSVVRFSRNWGNLRAFSTDPEAPTCNVALVGGSGDGASRYVLEVADSASVTAWGRIEKWVSQGNSSDFDTVTAAGQQALVEGAESVGLAAVAVDTTDQMYGRDYGLGDKVSIELFDGQFLAEIVRAVRLEATPETGEKVTPSLGTDAARRDSATITAIRQLERRLGQIERR